MLEARLLKKDEKNGASKRKRVPYPVSSLRNTIGLGDCVELLDEMPAASVDLVFTSPPYFNARPEYSDYEVYEEYLFKMRQVINRAHRVLNEGRFFVINCAPVLLRRASRNEASKRIAVPFDLHRLFVEEGYDFIDDIIWLKPEELDGPPGAGDVLLRIEILCNIRQCQ
jgi:DNA modification methylase